MGALMHLKRGGKMQDKITKISSLLLGLLIVAACNSPSNSNDSLGIGIEDSNNITGGRAVPQKAIESLSTVALYAPTKSADPKVITIQNFCTGTLIASDVVMTAAHCIADFAQAVGVTQDQLVKNIAVGFGTQVLKQISPSSQIRLVKNFIVHPDYVIDSVKQATTVAMHDIALLRLSSPAPSGAQVAPLVTKDRNLLRKGLQVTLVGFGLLNAQPAQEAKQMMEVNVSIDNPAITSTQFTYLNIGGRSSCSGDSGGPAYVKLPSGQLGVIGITSWGDTLCKKIGAYTSVPAFSDWIQQALQLL